MQIREQNFGEWQGRPVKQIALHNDHGLEMRLINYGGTVTDLWVPDRNGRRGNIVCGFDRLESYFSEAYLQNAPYFGCLVGRYAGRIKNGRFTLNGKEYQLATNDGPNHLHGGLQGFDKRIWEIYKKEETADELRVTLRLLSEDGDQGYPGNLEVLAVYALTNNNELYFEYQASTDRATPLSLTNHTYFNLNGFTDTILDHVVQIDAPTILAVDETNVPSGEQQPVQGSAKDLRRPRLLKDLFGQLPEGFEDYYVFGDETHVPKKVGRISHPGSGRVMDIATTEPGMLFYTGRYTSDRLRREDGTAYGRFRAFCCETSRFPNGPNIPNSPGTILEPGVSYYSKTVFTFSTQQEETDE